MPRADLQLLSHEFRDLVSQASRSHYQHLQTNLRRVIVFVRETTLLAEAVDSAPRPSESLDATIQHGRQGRDRFRPIDDRKAELGFLHDLLCRFVEMEPKTFESFVVGYGYSSKIADSVSELVADTLAPYSTHLRRTFTAAMVSSSEGAGHRLEINTSGGLSQVVVHQGQGDVKASQLANQETSELAAAADSLLTFLGSSEGQALLPELAEELADIARELPREVAKEQPSKWGLKAMQERLNFLIATTELAEKVRPYMDPLLSALAAYRSAHGL